MGKLRGSERRQHVEALYDRGLSIPAICKRLGLSRQLVHYFINGRGRRWRVRCLQCNTQINPAGAMPRHDRTVYCLTCLNRQGGVPFAVWLRSHRLAAGLPIVALARRAGMWPSDVTALERQRNPSVRLDTARRLAEVLGVPLIGVRNVVRPDDAGPETLGASAPQP